MRKEFKGLLAVKCIVLLVSLFSIQLQASSTDYIDCDPKIYNKYDVTNIKDFLVKYRNSKIIWNSEAWKTYGTIISELDDIENRGAHCYVAILPDIYSDKDQLFEVLNRHYEKIGKAEHLKRLFEALSITLSSTKKKDELKKHINEQTLLVDRLYGQKSLSHLLRIAKDFKNEGLLSRSEIRFFDLAYIDYVRETAIDEKLKRQWDLIKVEGRRVHGEVKKNSDDKRALEWLEKVFNLSRKIGSAVQKNLGLKTPYDGLLALYQPGFDSNKIDALYNKLVPEMSMISKKAIELQKDKKSPSIPEGPYDLNKQASFNTDLTKVFGVDRNRYLIDFSNTHSIEGGIRSDVHLVVKLGNSRLNDFTSSARSTIHELGHGIYIDSIPAEQMFTPMGKLMGTGVEEGFAFLFEKIIGRMKGFSNHMSSLASDIFAKDIDPDAFYSYKNWIKPGVKRISADEVTYGLHTFIRMDIERDVINGVRKVSDIPNRWKVMYHKLLANTPATSREGYLQDIQWFKGSVGMFPFYTVGDVVAAQLWHKMKKRFPDINSRLERGDVSEVRRWIEKNFGKKGRYADLDAYMEATTTQPLNPSHLIRHWKERYL